MSYKNHLKIGKGRSGGNGVFTTINIPARSPVIEVTGDIFTNENYPDHPAVLQIGKKTFIGPSGDVDDYVNHSCNPNCYLVTLGNRAMLYSLHTILAGTEITFDYSTSSTDTLNTWKMNCKCGYINCRKVISGIQYLDPELVKKYDSKGMIPLFIKNEIFE